MNFTYKFSDKYFNYLTTYIKMPDTIVEFQIGNGGGGFVDSFEKAYNVVKKSNAHSKIVWTIEKQNGNDHHSWHKCAKKEHDDTERSFFCKLNEDYALEPNDSSRLFWMRMDLRRARRLKDADDNDDFTHGYLICVTELMTDNTFRKRFWELKAVDHQVSKKETWTSFSNRAKKNGKRLKKQRARQRKARKTVSSKRWK